MVTIVRPASPGEQCCHREQSSEHMEVPGRRREQLEQPAEQGRQRERAQTSHPPALALVTQLPAALEPDDQTGGAGGCQVHQ